MNPVLNYLAGKPRWAVQVAVWALLLGAWAATLIRAGEILRDEDMPLTRPVTIDLGLERTP